MKVIATKAGKFSPRDGEPFALKPGDDVPASMADAALAQGWGKQVSTPKPAAGKKDAKQDVEIVDAEDI